MTKMEKLGSNFFSPDEVKQAIKKYGKCEVKFVSEPVKKKNEKYGNFQYHVDIETKNPSNDKLEVREWSMNGKSSDYYMEEQGWDDTEDFIGKTDTVNTAKVSTKEGMKDTIYPDALME